MWWMLHNIVNPNIFWTVLKISFMPETYYYVKWSLEVGNFFIVIIMSSAFIKTSQILYTWPIKRNLYVFLKLYCIDYIYQNLTSIIKHQKFIF